MLPEGLQRAKRPAKALADELAGGIGSFRPSDGLFVVANAPANPADGNGQVGVFGHGVRGDPAGGFDGLLAPGAESARNHGDAIEKIKGAFFHVLAGDVFERLPARQPARTIADLDVARDRAHGGIAEMPDQLANGIGFDFCIRVDGHHDFRLRLRHGHAQRRRFAAVHLVHDAYARFARKMRIQQLSGFVRGTVVHYDEMQIRIIGKQHGMDGFNDDLFFVVRGNQHGNAGQRRGHLGAVRPQFLDERQDANDQRAAANEDDSENKRGGDGHPKPVINAEDEAVGARLELFLR